MTITEEYAFAAGDNITMIFYTGCNNKARDDGLPTFYVSGDNLSYVSLKGKVDQTETHQIGPIVKAHRLLLERRPLNALKRLGSFLEVIRRKLMMVSSRVWRIPNPFVSAPVIRRNRNPSTKRPTEQRPGQTPRLQHTNNEQM